MILEELLYFGFLAYVIAYSFGLVLILDGMDLCSYDRERNDGYVCIQQEPNFTILGYEFHIDLWHHLKILLIFYILIPQFGFTWYLALGYLITFIGHEHLFFNGWFKKYKNN
jgi:hypothetical protein